MAFPTLVNVLLALLPRVVMAAMHTTMMRASMTAYSTAVGPSSRLRKFTKLFNMALSKEKQFAKKDPKKTLQRLTQQGD
jgi:hypothetical protein